MKEINQNFWLEEDKEKLTNALQELYENFEIEGKANTILKSKTDNYLKIKIYENGYITNAEAVRKFNSTPFKYHTIGEWFLARYENFGGLRLYEYEIPLFLIKREPQTKFAKLWNMI